MLVLNAETYVYETLTSRGTSLGVGHPSLYGRLLRKQTLAVLQILGDSNLLLAVDGKELNLKDKSRVGGDEWLAENVLGGKPRGPYA